MFLHSTDIYFTDYLYHYTRFSMQNSARQTVSRMYMPFLNDLKILPANPAQNFFLHTISLCLHLQIQKEFYGFFELIFVFFFLALNLIAYHFADGIKRKIWFSSVFLWCFTPGEDRNIFCFCSAWSLPPAVRLID